jgi:pilus assembly protein CpaE
MALSQESRSIIELPTPIERADRLPAGRVPLLAFVADRQTKTDVEESLAPLALADSPVMRGGIVKAIQFLASERSPETLIVDISGVEMPAARIQELAEVCEPGVTVIAIGDHNDIALYRDLMHAGVHDYIVKPVAPQALAEALDLRPGQAGAPISHRLAKLVALVGARGGVGTTTVAANLAWYLANRQNRRVALLDLNLQRGDCALALNVTPTAGLREALTNPARLDLVFLERVMAVQGDRLFVLSAEEPFDHEVKFTGDAVDRLVGLLRTQFHYVIVDVPDLIAEPNRRVLDLANLRVVVADRTLRSVRDTARLRLALGEGDLQHRNVLVINRNGEGGRHAVKLNEMRGIVEMEPRCVIPFQPHLFSAAAGAGWLAAERRNRFTDGVATLAGELSGRSSERRGWRRVFK